MWKNRKKYNKEESIFSPFFSHFFRCRNILLELVFTLTNSPDSIINTEIHCNVGPEKVNNSTVYLKTILMLKWNLGLDEMAKYIWYD